MTSPGAGSMRRLGMILFLGVFGILVLSYQEDIPVEDLKSLYAKGESQFVMIDSMDVHYRIEGEGEPILLIHGTAASLHTWDVWTEYLKDEFKVVRLDLPAFGLTGPNLNGDYSQDFYVDFIDKFLQSQGIDSCHIAGNSLGGSIAWNYAVAYSDKVQKLILVDASGYQRKGEVPYIFKLARNEITAGILKVFTPKSVIKNNLQQVYFDDSKITNELVDRYFKMALREGNRQAFVDRANLDYPDRSHLVKEISAPTLILWGEHDSWVPLDFAYKFEKDIADSQLVIYEDAGHVPMEEIPNKSVADALNFLLAE